ncbi:hypothetical protein ACSQ5K_22790 [Pseudomonas sp. PhalM4]
MKVKNWDGWEPEWLKLVDHYQDAPALPGVYIICADRAIERAVGIDENGILTVGESDNLKRRLSAFVRCAGSKGSTGHMAGWRFSFASFERCFHWIRFG